HRILKRRGMDDLEIRLLRPLDFFRRRHREGARASFLARPEAAVPEIDERLKAPLQRVELEPLGGPLDVAAVPLLDERLDALARLPGRTRQAAGKELVVLDLELLQPRRQHLEIFLDFSLVRHGASPNEKPDEREPELTRVRDGFVVDEHLGALVAA